MLPIVLPLTLFPINLIENPPSNWKVNSNSNEYFPLAKGNCHEIALRDHVRGHFPLTTVWWAKLTGNRIKYWLAIKFRRSITQMINDLHPEPNTELITNWIEGPSHSWPICMDPWDTLHLHPIFSVSGQAIAKPVCTEWRINNAIRNKLQTRTTNLQYKHATATVPRPLTFL